MKQFDIKKAKQGHPVCTRGGKKVRVLAFDVKCYKPLVVAIQENNGDREEIYTYALNGIFLGNNNLSEYDLMMSDEHHEGWVNVYSSDKGYHVDKEIWEFEENAIEIGKEFPDYVATVKIEWEE